VEGNTFTIASAAKASSCDDPPTLVGWSPPWLTATNPPSAVATFTAALLGMGDLFDSAPNHCTTCTTRTTRTLFRLSPCYKVAHYFG